MTDPDLACEVGCYTFPPINGVQGQCPETLTDANDCQQGCKLSYTTPDPALSVCTGSTFEPLTCSVAASCQGTVSQSPSTFAQFPSCLSACGWAEWEGANLVMAMSRDGNDLVFGRPHAANDVGSKEGRRKHTRKKERGGNRQGKGRGGAGTHSPSDSLCLCVCVLRVFFLRQVSALCITTLFLLVGCPSP
jgi:hypothetical protein